MPDNPKISPLTGRLIILIVGVMALVALYANVQKARRDVIETVIMTPITTATPTPTPR